MLDLTQDYFQLFGIERGFEVDEDLISERYRELQRTLHPDRFVSATDQERRLSMQGSTLVNEAFETLRSPLTRAIYLIELAGVSLDDQDEPLSPMFLMEQMELREELETVREASDPFAALDQLNSDIRQRIRSHETELGEAFAHSDGGDLQPVCTLVRELQFLSKLQHQALELEESLDDY